MGRVMMRWAIAVVVTVVMGAVAAAQTTGGQALAGVDQQQPRAQGGRLPPRAMPRPADTEVKGTSILRGVVLAADSGAPIRRAPVRVSARESRLATTDAQGRFEIRDLPAGRYTMTASKGGFVTLQYGQRRPSESGTPLELGDGQTLDKLVIGLPRGSVIGGRVTDEFGEPVANASVTALRYSWAGGSRRLTQAGARDTTDDQGQYRLFGLPPGEYIVSANLRTAEATDPAADELGGYAPTYFPGTPNAGEAQRVTLGVSQENTSVSFGLIATKLVRISGQVVTSQGGPPPGGAVFLTQPGGLLRGGPGMQGGGGRIDANGTFRISNVAPGRYVIQARTGARAEGEFARMDLAVGAQDVEGLTLVTAPGARVRGTVTLDTNQNSQLQPSQVQVIARAATSDSEGFGGGSTTTARLAADWSFELGNLVDTRLFRVGAPDDWSLKSVALNGQDITDTPTEFAPGQTLSGLHIVLTKQTSSASGVVTNDRDEPLLDATVVVFPPDEKLWIYQSRHIKAARPNQEGKFQIAGLPPGDYLAVAVQGLENGQAGDPDVLARLKERAASFSVKPSETKTLNLKLSTGR
jgi:hypothetical protein